MAPRRSEPPSSRPSSTSTLERSLADLFCFLPLSLSHSPLSNEKPQIQTKPQVISTAMMKTVMVAVDRVAVVPKYKVTVRRTKKLMAHDEGGRCLLGDTVRVESCRPLSKRKTWVVSEILRRERTLGGGSGEAAAAVAASSPSPFSSCASSSSSSRGFAASAFRHASL